MSEWINLEERQPKSGQKVLIKTFNLNGEEIEIEAVFMIYDIDEETLVWGWNIGSRKDTIAKPTYWQPLPSSPSL